MAKGGKGDTDDGKSVSGDGHSVTTAATFDTKLSADTLKPGQAEVPVAGQLDDVSVLGMEQDSVVTLEQKASIDENKDAESAIMNGNDAESEVGALGEDGTEDVRGMNIAEEGGEEKEKGEEKEEMPVHKQEEGEKASGEADAQRRRSSMLLPKPSLPKKMSLFSKKGQKDETRLSPTARASRRFSMAIDGFNSNMKKFSVFSRGKGIGDIEIEPYQPALDFHERMAGRREKFARKKEEVADLVANAGHNRFDLSGAMKFV